MRDATVPKNLQEIWRRISLDRIERFARKLLDKEAGGSRSSVRAIEDNRFVRRQSANYCSSVRIMVQFKGPPKVSFNKAALRFGSPPYD